MPVAIDTSVLISAEKQGDFDALLPEGEEGPYYIPSLAASEFPVGTQPPVRADLRQRASQLYQSRFRALVSSFTEADAAQLAALISELKTQGQQMNLERAVGTTDFTDNTDEEEVWGERPFTRQVRVTEASNDDETVSHPWNP